MAATDPITPEPRCFSIRLPRPLWIGVAAIVLVVVGIASWAATLYRRHHEQCRAIQQVERLGGSIDTRQSGPSWLRNIVGGEPLNVLDEVTYLWLADRPVTDSDLAEFSRLLSVEVLGLPGTRISDAGLVHIARLERLRILEIGHTAVTDTGVAQLGRLRRLRILSLRYTGVTDVGLEYLEGMTSLKVLDVEGSGVSADGVQLLQRSFPALAVNH